jgi:rRNA maturation endonuclease Nob1
MRGKSEEIDSHRVVLNYIKRKGTTLPPVFANTGRCQACGKVTHVNTFGFCERCWVTYAHLRRKK